MAHTSLVQRSLELAAGTRVDGSAYEGWNINLAKLQSLGRCYREGWLHNVLRRITPLTIRQLDDYAMMADLFVMEKAEAQILLARMSRDLSTFATTAGTLPGHASLQQHTALYEKLSTLLAEKFSIEAPAPFASTTFDAEAQAQMPFVRNFLRQRAVA